MEEKGPNCIDKEKFSIIVLLSIEKRGWQYFADLRQR